MKTQDKPTFAGRTAHQKPIAFRVTAEEQAELTRETKRTGQTPSQVVRSRVFMAGPKGPKVRPIDP